MGPIHLRKGSHEEEFKGACQWGKLWSQRHLPSRLKSIDSTRLNCRLICSTLLHFSSPFRHSSPLYFLVLQGNHMLQRAPYRFLFTFSITLQLFQCLLETPLFSWYKVQPIILPCQSSFCFL